MNKFNRARAEEIKYHESFYLESTLFEPGTWLARPVKIVLEMLDRLNSPNLRILDLGCGVGRNSIPMAQKIKEHHGTITCVDLIPTAIDLLIANAEKFKVQDQIVAEVADAEGYNIPPCEFDYIVACSCLEHVSSVEAFKTVVKRMIAGTKDNGINTILMSTEIKETDIETQQVAEGLIELNLETEKTFMLLEDLYRDWEILHKRTLPQTMRETKYGKEIEFQSNWITFAARRREAIV
ncbi:class I SAM-dependent methyltransferase [Cohnella cellulosilytica]|uniref:Class I SAM-dependent methyltransferase n=1 Tax=Cohnella cellulosilytica TaxID=986710 RepID=A0ABW2FLH4_9BACL